jgi:transposase
VLRAVDRGDRPTEIARRIEGSRIWVYQVRSRVLKTGERGSLRIGGYRKSRLSESEQQLRSWIAAEPSLTLAELQLRLSEQGITVKTGALWHQLNKWTLTFKKNSARHRTRARGRTAGAPDVDGRAAGDGT